MQEMDHDRRPDQMQEPDDQKLDEIQMQSTRPHVVEHDTVCVNHSCPEPPTQRGWQELDQEERVRLLDQQLHRNEIERRAYFIWQESGREDAKANWYQALKEYRNEQTKLTEQLRDCAQQQPKPPTESTRQQFSDRKTFWMSLANRYFENKYTDGT